MNKANKILLATGIAALGAATLAGASLADGGPRHHGHGGPGGWRGEGFFEQFDANQDGTLTQAEIDEARRSRLAEFDRDGDGRLTLDEYQALWIDAMRERMVDRFQALDDDGDAVVTTEEFVEPFGRTISRLDRNEDGELTRDEMRRRQRDRGDDRGRDDRRG